METSKISLHNLQNLHSTNWLRVVNVTFIFLFLSFTVYRVWEMCLVSLSGDIPWAGNFQRFFFGNFFGQGSL